MPELAEVAYYARQWDAGIGSRVAEIEVHPRARVFRDTDSVELTSILTGSIYRGSRTHGKQILFEFSGGRWLWAQLGMTGSICTEPSEHHQEKHDHLVLRQKQRCLVFRDPRMFGRVRFFQSAKGKAPNEWDGLPPEVLSDEFTATHLEKVLRRRAKTLIKPLLLDQNFFPGVGNWMADEILWRARVHPSQPAGSLLPQTSSLCRRTREVCRGAMRVIAPDWGDPPRSWLFTHRWKDGGSCPRCGFDLERIQLRGRTTCLCATCQTG